MTADPTAISAQPPDYQFHHGQGADSLLQLSGNWTQAQAQLGGILALARHWRLYGGGSYGKVDGEERASGSVNHTLSFERGAQSGGFLGLDLNVETDGYIGVELRSGLMRGGEIYFKRRF